MCKFETPPACGASHINQRTPNVPRRFKPPKFHKKTPRRRRGKNENFRREREKKREILAPHPFGAPPFGALRPCFFVPNAVSFVSFLFTHTNTDTHTQSHTFIYTFTHTCLTHTHSLTPRAPDRLWLRIRTSRSTPGRWTTSNTTISREDPERHRHISRCPVSPHIVFWPFLGPPRLCI